MASLSLGEIIVRADHSVAFVHVDGPMRTSAYPGLAARALEAMPTLANHRCDNGAGLPSARELADTELPHALEHVALDLLRRAGVRGTIRGETSWDFALDGPGVFRVAIFGADPTSARAALEAGCEFVDQLTGSQGAAASTGAGHEREVAAATDPAALVARVRAARTAQRRPPTPRPRRR